MIPWETGDYFSLEIRLPVYNVDQAATTANLTAAILILASNKWD